MQLVERIKMIAAQQGYSLSQLEQHLGFGTRTIYKWDKNSPSVEKVLAVANFLHVSLSWLVTGKYETCAVSPSFLERYERLSDSDKEKIDHFIEICLCGGPRPAARQSRRLPLLGYVSEEALTEGIRFLGYTQAETDADYALIMEDSGMKPLWSQGETVFVKNEESLSHGDIGIFYMEHRLLCRQFLTYDNLVELRPLDRRFPARQFSAQTFSRSGIAGKVVLTRHQKELLSIFFEPKI